MTRYLLAAAALAGSLLAATPASACELQYCSWAQPVCNLHVVDCADPIPDPYPCLLVNDAWVCF